MSELLIPDEATTLLPVSEVLAVQGLAMGYVRERARRVHTNRIDRVHGFVFYKSSPTELGSGDTETFMTVRVRKPDFRRWRMVISFLDLELTEERRYSNHRDVYEFDWANDEDCFAIRRSREMFNEILETREDPERGVVDLVQPRVTVDVEPLSPGDCDELCERMIAVTRAVNAA